MRPRTAYIFSAITLRIGINLGFEKMLVNMNGEQAAISKDSVQSKDIENPKGYDPWGSFPGAEKMGKKGFEFSEMDKLVDQTGNSLVVTGRSAKPGGLSRLIPGSKWDPIHTGAIGRDFPFEGIIPVAPKWAYATFYGTCHQATNATLLMSGVSNTVFEIYPHWSTFVSTAIYGNYGGGLVRSALAGVAASNRFSVR